MGDEAIYRGCYIAIDGNTGIQIACEEFVVSRAPGGLLATSCETFFGPTPVVQECRFWLEPDWTPRRVEARSGDVAVEGSFHDCESIMSILTPTGKEEMRILVPRREAYFALNAGLYFPLHLVNRFRFQDGRPQWFHYLPHGLCELVRLDDELEGGHWVRVLRMRVQMEGVTDEVRLWIGEDGAPERYVTRNLNCVVKLEREL